ncbi:MAG: hypothetical protein ACSLEN_03285 [Candidatus Malihini olakiniferum]
MKTVVDNETAPPDELPDAALVAAEDVADSDALDMRRRGLLLPLSDGLHDARAGSTARRGRAQNFLLCQRCVMIDASF